MCDTLHLTDGENSEVRQRRTQRLQGWVDEDLDCGDPSLTTALERWRDDLVARLPHDRPLPLRLPRIFVACLAHFGITEEDRRVVLLPNDEVRRLLKWHRREKHADVGDVIVSSRTAFLEAWSGG